MLRLNDIHLEAFSLHNYWRNHVDLKKRPLARIQYVFSFYALMWFHFRNYIMWARDPMNIWKKTKKNFGGFCKICASMYAKFNGKRRLNCLSFACRWIMPWLWRKMWEWPVYNSDGFWLSRFLYEIRLHTYITYICIWKFEIQNRPSSIYLIDMAWSTLTLLLTCIKSKT